MSKPNLTIRLTPAGNSFSDFEAERLVLIYDKKASKDGFLRVRTSSSNIIHAARALYAEGKLSSKLHLEYSKHDGQVRSLFLLKDGTIDNWPEDFDTHWEGWIERVMDKRFSLERA